MTGRIIAVTVPKWGIEMQEGTLVAWHVEEGATVAKGSDIVDLETEKIVNTLESPGSGALRRKLAAEGDTLDVGALLGVLADPEVSDADIDAFIAGFVPAETSFDPHTEAPAATTQASSASARASATTGQPEVRISPVARRLAERLGVDISRVQGTGRNGRISKEDVERAAAQQAATAAGGLEADYTAQPMSGRRRTIARRLVEAKRNIPHYYLGDEIALDALLARRAEMNEGRGQERISVNDLLVRAAGLALAAEPDLNVTVVGDEIRRYRHADICVAIDTAEGLVAPVIRAADTRSVEEISSAIRDLSSRAKRGELTPQDLEGGSFTVSNLGMYGITEFIAVINPPQGAILAVGGARPGVVAREGRPEIATLLSVTLSCDHRAIDGAMAARFLKTFRELLETVEAL